MTGQLPDDAITAAADVLRGEIWADDRFEPDHQEIARLVLEEAAPLIAARAAAAERERITAELRNQAAGERDAAITARSPGAAEVHIHASAALDTAADLLDGGTGGQ